MDQRKAIILIVAILVAGSLAACCILGGIGYYLYQNDLVPGVSQPPANPMVNPTRPPIAQNPRPTPLPPTSLPPTTVPTAAATPTPATQIVRTWAFDEADGWDATRSDGGYNVVEKSISGGKYDWQVTARQPGNHQTYLTDLPEGTLPADHYQVSVEVQRLDGVESAAYGIVFNYVDGDNFITFLMNDLGNCLISARSDGQWQDIGGGVQSSPAVRTGEVNDIDVKVSPQAIYAYINGQLAASAEGLNLGPIDGTVGLSAEMYNAGDSVHLQFDNFSILHPLVFRK